MQSIVIQMHIQFQYSKFQNFTAEEEVKQQINERFF